MKYTSSSRRDVIKKATFIVPAVMTFQLDAMKAYASSGVPGNNGNHYGNSRPDQNSKDHKNWHNTAD